MADLRDPNALHCRKDTRATGGSDCHGESYCSCQCDGCKAAHECSAEWYAEHPPKRERHPVVFRFGGAEHHLTLDEAHLALARLRDAIGSALDEMAAASAPVARSVPSGAHRHPGEPEYSYRPHLVPEVPKPTCAEHGVVIHRDGTCGLGCRGLG